MSYIIILAVIVTGFDKRDQKLLASYGEVYMSHRKMYFMCYQKLKFCCAPSGPFSHVALLLYIANLCLECLTAKIIAKFRLTELSQLATLKFQFIVGLIN